MKRWAVGITILYVTFVVAVVTMVIFMNSTNFDLVVEDYYEKDINYQKHIDKVKRTSDDKMDIIISYNDNKLLLKFSDKINYSNCNGEVFFYYPAFKKEDFKVKLNIDSKGNQIIDISESVKKGNWLVKIDWIYQGKSYYSEENIFID